MTFFFPSFLHEPTLVVFFFLFFSYLSCTNPHWWSSSSFSYYYYYYYYYFDVFCFAILVVLFFQIKQNPFEFNPYPQNTNQIKQPKKNKRNKQQRRSKFAFRSEFGLKINWLCSIFDSSNCSQGCEVTMVKGGWDLDCCGAIERERERERDGRKSEGVRER